MWSCWLILKSHFHLVHILLNSAVSSSLADLCHFSISNRNRKSKTKENSVSLDFMNTENVQRFPYPSANSIWRVDHNRRDNRGDNPHNSNFQNEIVVCFEARRFFLLELLASNSHTDNSTCFLEHAKWSSVFSTTCADTLSKKATYIYTDM